MSIYMWKEELKENKSCKLEELKKYIGKFAVSYYYLGVKVHDQGF